MEVHTSQGRARVLAGARTHVGRKRLTNEDFVFMRPKLGLFLVADGVGGRKAGQVASSLAAYSMHDFFKATRRVPWPPEYQALRDRQLPPGLQRLGAAIRKANRDVATAASKRPEHDTMTTTVVAAHLDHAAGVVHVGHVGDSRCYLFRDGVLERLTSDHTLRNKARSARPDFTRADLARIPGHVLTGALGASPSVRMDLVTLALLPGDRLLLCTDGLYRMIDNTRIAEALQLRDDPGDACELLTTLANGRGGRDNISAVLVRLDAA